MGYLIAKLELVKAVLQSLNLQPCFLPLYLSLVIGAFLLCGNFLYLFVLGRREGGKFLMEVILELPDDDLLVDFGRCSYICMGKLVPLSSAIYFCLEAISSLIIDISVL